VIRLNSTANFHHRTAQDAMFTSSNHILVVLNKVRVAANGGDRSRGIEGPLSVRGVGESVVEVSAAASEDQSVVVARNGTAQAAVNIRADVDLRDNRQISKRKVLWLASASALTSRVVKMPKVP